MLTTKITAILQKCGNIAKVKNFPKESLRIPSVNCSGTQKGPVSRDAFLPATDPFFLRAVSYFDEHYYQVRPQQLPIETPLRLKQRY